MVSKPWYKSWTLVCAIIAGIAEAAQQLGDIFPSGKFHQYLASVVIIAMFVLRFKTVNAIQGFEAPLDYPK